MHLPSTISRHTFPALSHLQSFAHTHQEAINIMMFLCTPLGVEAMKQYKVEVEKLENERQELANAERLFDLPITMYPELLQVQKDMKGMEQIYTLYEDQKVKKNMAVHSPDYSLLAACQDYFDQEIGIPCFTVLQILFDLRITLTLDGTQRQTNLHFALPLLADKWYSRGFLTTVRWWLM